MNRSGGEEFETFLGQGVAFDIFRTDGEEAHLGFFVAENFFRVDGTHQSVVEKVFGAGVEIGAGIEENEEIGFGGHNGGNARTTNTRQGAEANGGGGHHGSSMAGGDSGFREVVPNGFDRAEDGIIPFATKGFDGRVPHLDDFLAVVNFDSGRRLGVAQFLEFLKNFFFLAKEKKLFDLRVVSQSFESGGHGACGSVISSHRIECNLHQKTREITGGGLGSRSLDGQDLAVAVPTRSGIDHVRQVKISTFVAAKLRQVATVRRPAHAKAHLGCFAFRDSHGFNSPF